MTDKRNSNNWWLDFDTHSSVRGVLVSKVDSGKNATFLNVLRERAFKSRLQDVLGRLDKINLGRQLEDALGVIVTRTVTDVEQAPSLFQVACELAQRYATNFEKYLTVKVVEQCKFPRGPVVGERVACLLANLWMVGLLSTAKFTELLQLFLTADVKTQGDPNVIECLLHAALGSLLVCGKELVDADEKHPSLRRLRGTTAPTPSPTERKAVCTSFEVVYRTCMECVTALPLETRDCIVQLHHVLHVALPDLVLPVQVSGHEALVVGDTRSDGWAPSDVPLDVAPMMEGVVDKTRKWISHPKHKNPCRIPPTVKIFAVTRTKENEHGLSKEELRLIESVLTVLGFVAHTVRKKPRSVYICGDAKNYHFAVKALHETMLVCGMRPVPWCRQEIGETLSEDAIEEVLRHWHASCSDAGDKMARNVREAKCGVLRTLSPQFQRNVTFVQRLLHLQVVAVKVGAQQKLESCKPLETASQEHHFNYERSPTQEGLYFFIGGHGTAQMVETTIEGAEVVRNVEAPLEPHDVQAYLLEWFRAYSSEFFDTITTDTPSNEAQHESVLPWVNRLRAIALDNINRQETLVKMNEVLVDAQRELEPSRNDGRWSELLLYMEQITLEYELQKYHMTGAFFTASSTVQGYVLLKINDDLAPFTERRPTVMARDDVLVTSRMPPRNETFILSVVHVSARQLSLTLKKGKMTDKKFVETSARFLLSVSKKHPFDVEFTFNKRSFDVKRKAVRDPVARMFLEGFPYPKFTLSDLPATTRTVRRMNPSQELAIQGILTGPRVFAVWGPPGTGKTSTLVEAVCRVLQARPNTKILICAPSNASADHFAMSLTKQDGLTNKRCLLRLYSTSMSPTQAPRELLQYTIPVFNRPPNDLDTFEVPEKLDPNKTVIVTTCITAALNCIKLAGPFDYVIVDEAAQAFEAECFAPLVVSGPGGKDLPRSLILGGDHRQLNPVVTSSLAKKYDLDLSLLERKVNEMPYVMLNECYRCHPKILSLFNPLFYDGGLKSAITVDTTEPWGKAIQFYHVEGLEEKLSTTSTANAEEAAVVYDVVTELAKKCIAPKDIGVISPYRLQINNLRGGFQMRSYFVPGLKDITVGTVDNFQGQEREVIIISTVRSSPQHFQLDARQALGFVQCPKRINVAVSRARALLVIVGNANILSQHDNNWKHVIDRIKEEGGFRYAKVPRGVQPVALMPAGEKTVPVTLREWTPELLEEGLSSGESVRGVYRCEENSRHIFVSEVNNMRYEVSTNFGLIKALPGATVVARLQTRPDADQRELDIPPYERLDELEPALDDGRPLRFEFPVPAPELLGVQQGATAYLVHTIQQPPKLQVVAEVIHVDGFDLMRAIDDDYDKCPVTMLPLNPEQLSNMHPTYLVEVDPERWGTFLSCKVLREVPPPPSQPRRGVRALIREVEEAESITFDLERVDLLDVQPCLAIDGPDVVAVDDAVSCQVCVDNPSLYTVGVHIVDINDLIESGSREDIKALEAVSTVYIPCAAKHMLPDVQLKRGSLLTGVDRSAISVLWTVDAEGVILEERIVRSKIRATQITYDDADLVLREQDDDGDFKDPTTRALLQLSKFAAVCRKRRLGDDVDILSRNFDFRFVPCGKYVDVVKECTDNSPAHALVEELMILANISVAQKIVEWIPQRALLVRQEPPRIKRLERIARVANTYVPGVALSPDTQMSYFRSLLQCKGTLTPTIFETLWTEGQRCSAPSQYCLGAHDVASSVRNHGIPTRFYTHFTSPLRRYADVIVHRQLLMCLQLEKAWVGAPPRWLLQMSSLSALCDHIDSTSRKNRQKERDSKRNLIEAYILRLCKESVTDMVLPGVVTECESQQFTVYVPQFDTCVDVRCDDMKKLSGSPVAATHWEAGEYVVTFVDESTDRLVPFSERHFAFRAVKSVTSGYQCFLMQSEATKKKKK